MVRVAHASRVLVSASRRNELLLIWKPGIHEAGKTKRGISIVSWLIGSISSFPAFLISFSGSLDLAMEFEKNTMLFGADPTPRIVAIELGETGTVNVYRREKDGSTVSDVEPFHPFAWCDSDVVDLGIETEKFEGDLKYGWLVTVDSWKELIDLRNGLKKAGRDFFAFSDPVQHYLTATGRTLFKELPFEELKRVQLEVLPWEDAVAGGGDPSNVDHVMSIALSDNTGWEELIMVDPNNVEESE